MQFAYDKKKAALNKNRFKEDNDKHNPKNQTNQSGNGVGKQEEVKRSLSPGDS